MEIHSASNEFLFITDVLAETLFKNTKINISSKRRLLFINTLLTTLITVHLSVAL